MKKEQTVAKKNNSTLTAEQKTQLTKCKKIITRHLNNSYEVGKALTQIRDEELYKAEAKTFEKYCLMTFNMSRAHAYRLISYSNIITTLGEEAHAQFINERVVRELGAIKDNAQRQEVWAKAKKLCEQNNETHVTISHVQQAKNEIIPADEMNEGVTVEELRNPQMLLKKAKSSSSEYFKLLLELKAKDEAAFNRLAKVLRQQYDELIHKEIAEADALFSTPLVMQQQAC